LVSIGFLLLAAVVIALVVRRLWLPPKGPAVKPGAGYSIIAAPFPAGGIRGRLVIGSAHAARLSSAVEPLPPPQLGCAPAPWVLTSALLDAVVSVDGITGGIAPPDAEPKLDLGPCGFTPRVSVGLAGATARVKSGPKHRLQAWVGGVRVFDAAQEGSAKVTIGDEAAWQLRCAEGHPWEQAWVHASAHPYHSVTDEKGRFRLEHVPAGKWKLRAWHPVLGESTREVEVVASETAELEWRF
jgi:hypothetical protein